MNHIKETENLVKNSPNILFFNILKAYKEYDCYNFCALDKASCQSVRFVLKKHAQILPGLWKFDKPKNFSIKQWIQQLHKWP